MGKQPKKVEVESFDDDQPSVMKVADNDFEELPVKKKGNTVSAPAQKEPSTQVGSDVSQEPGVKGAQPSGKSTEGKEQQTFDTYSKDLEKRLWNTYSNKYKTEENDFITKLGGLKQPDLTNEKEVNTYNDKIAQLKAFQQKRGKEIDDEFKGQFQIESKSALDKFNIKPIKAEQDKQDQDYQKLLDQTNKPTIQNPFVESLKTAPPPIMRKEDADKNARKVVSEFQKEITGNPESEGFITDLGTSNIPGALNQAFVTGVAAVPKTVAVLAQKLDQLTGAPPKKIEEYATFQAGQFIEDKARELGLTVLDNPDHAGFMTSTVPQAVGSMLSMMMLGGNPLGATETFATQSIAKQTAKTLTSRTALVGASQVGVAEFEAAKAAGKTDEEAFGVFVKNIPGGLTESFQMANMFGRLNKMTNNGIINAIKLGTANGIEEGAQEALQQYLSNKVAAGTYDPERDLAEGLGEGAGAGFIVGFFMPGVMAAMGSMTPQQRAKTKTVLQGMLEKGYYVKTPQGFSGKSPVQPIKAEPIKSTAQVITEAKSPITSTEDTAGIEAAADKIIESTKDEKPQDQTTTPEGGAAIIPKAETQEELPLQEKPEEQGEGVVTTSQTPAVLITETQEPTSTVGTNYRKVQDRWQVKQADGTWVNIISDKPNKTQAEQNTELAQMKDLLAQMEAQEPQNIKMSNTEKYNIKQIEPTSAAGKVRRFFWNVEKNGGKGGVLWSSKQDDPSSKPRKGIKEESGMSDSERSALKNYIDDKTGLSPDQIAEKLGVSRQDVIDVIANTDPKNWYADHLEESDEYTEGAPARYEERNRLSTTIAELEAQEQSAQETNKQLYENERRVNSGRPDDGQGTSGQDDTGNEGQAREGSEGTADASQSIRENGDEAKSKQALEELDSLVLTHVPGLGMGQNQAKGIYLSTEKENRYATEEKKPVRVKANIKNPFVSIGNVFYDIQRKIIQARFGKNSIDELIDTEGDLLAEMVNEHFINEGYDAIYFPQSETQEGEIVVFNRENVIFPDPFADAVHAAMQTKLELDMVPAKALMETDRPVELRSRQRDIRRRLDILNKLINCR